MNDHMAVGKEHRERKGGGRKIERKKSCKRERGGKRDGELRETWKQILTAKLSHVKRKKHICHAGKGTVGKGRVKGR